MENFASPLPEKCEFTLSKLRLNYSLGKSIRSDLSLNILNCVNTATNLRRYPDL